MIRVGMSTSCVYPLGVEEGFRYAKLAGYDGVEVMVTRDEVTQTAETLLALSAKYEIPILSIHAPVLLLTHFVWGRDPQVKLEKSAELAQAVGATAVVVHPPFRWQSEYAENFLRIVRETSENHGVEIAVENMFPWKVKGTSLKAYSPGWDPLPMDCDAVTLDFSHAALSGRDSLEMAQALGARLRHIHLCDGSGSLDEGRVFDEHLLPGYGGQPVHEVLDYLASTNWSGSVVAEVNTRKAKTEDERLALLTETLAFGRMTAWEKTAEPLKKRKQKKADKKAGKAQKRAAQSAS
ncbi:sugar phosphate isomerase/epimerase family protein [Subtercola sp. YIM 133946]|uniref:sugar phosphate isomerase/epimerase family protein n=1 Tax=Subtercola sp. YIM 133946 TaxID=3118909 RepID=UPI002F94CD80